MIDRNRLLRAGATLVIAGSAGFVMQYGGATAERFSPESKQQTDVVAEIETPLLAVIPTPPADILTPEPMSLPKLSVESRVAELVPSVKLNLKNDASTPMLFAKSCDVTMSALPEQGALVRLLLEAPCYQNQRITVEHAGLEFADVTDNVGNYSVSVPVLDENQPFQVRFADGRSVDAQTLMLTLDGYERVAIMWDGPAALHINALEYGADFGEEGHVWAQAPRDPEAGVQAEGGFLIQLGNPDVFNPRLAEVYSFPFDRMARDGSVDLIVEATLDSRTCGREMEAKSFQLSGGGSVKVGNVSLSFPGCDGENGYLLLKNLLQDLKIARN